MHSSAINTKKMLSSMDRYIWTYVYNIYIPLLPTTTSGATVHHRCWYSLIITNDLGIRGLCDQRAHHLSQVHKGLHVNLKWLFSNGQCRNHNIISLCDESILLLLSTNQMHGKCMIGQFSTNSGIFYIPVWTGQCMARSRSPQTRIDTDITRKQVHTG